jgi:hypothetical protein
MSPTRRRIRLWFGVTFGAIASLCLAFLLWLQWPDANRLTGQAARGDLAGARWSLRLGVDPNTASRWGWRHENEGETPMTVAAQFGRVEVVRLLLAHGADPDLRDGGGQHQTPLSTAAMHGQLEVCRLLLDAGADPNIRTNPAMPGDPGDWTALDWALQANHSAVAEFLRQHGAVEGRRGGG